MLLTLNHIGLRYNQNRAVLQNISFSLAPGSFHFLTGPSGAGKSSLLRIIYLAEKPSEGNINLFGHDIAKMARHELPALRRQIGVIFQDFRLIPHLSALENAALPLRLAGAREDYIQRHTSELLDWVGLGDRLHALPSSLSGGEQQRAAIARAIVNKPKLLLADEPTGNVDEESAMRLTHLFNELNKMGTAIVLATHQQDLIQRLNKPSLWLKEGRLIAPFPPSAKAA